MRSEILPSVVQWCAGERLSLSAAHGAGGAVQSCCVLSFVGVALHLERRRVLADAELA
ncbi:hypothetical protein D3C71_2155540 [compost metagenome]